MKDTILIDFDGVLRHWSGTEVKDAETTLGLDRGTLFSWAFSPQLLIPAITGVISHEEWRGRVYSKLAHLYDDNIASQLVAAWDAASWEIDTHFLRGLQQLTPTCKLVLVTNATSRLDSDLRKAGLASTFDWVVDSSQIKVAKPDPCFFEKALSIAGSKVSDAVFIDDRFDNVNAARSMGIASIHHKKPTETLEFIQQQLSGTSMAIENISTIPTNTLGQRILVIGNSCSGKSTLGSQLAALLDIPFVELDALNWEPNWVGLNETNPDELIRRMQTATVGDSWAIAGSYTKFSQQAFWPRLETIIWLDLPLHQLVGRMIKRSWRRSRSKELLWGTNYEKFWPQLMVWRKEDALLWWIVTQYQRKRQKMLEYQIDPQWSHIRFIRLCSSAEIQQFTHQITQTKSPIHRANQTLESA